MTTELQKRAAHPVTGEVLDLDRPTSDLAGFLDDVRGFESKLREAKALVTAEILKRMDSNAAWSERAGDFDLKSQSPAPKTEWDGEMLHDILDQLADEGLISGHAVEAALEATVVYKPKPKGINALLKREELRERILPAKSESEKRRYVTVTRVL